MEAVRAVNHATGCRSDLDVEQVPNFRLTRTLPLKSILLQLCGGQKLASAIFREGFLRRKKFEPFSSAFEPVSDGHDR